VPLTASRLGRNVTGGVMWGWSLNATFCPFLGLCATADQLLRRFEEPVPAEGPIVSWIRRASGVFNTRVT
jgi:hypothetical protein